MNYQKLRVIFSNYLDQAAKLVIELLQILCRYPPLGVDFRSYLMDRIAVHERFSDSEAGDIASLTFRNVPTFGNLMGVLLVGYGIENRLFRQAGRPTFKTALFYQLQF